MAALSLDELKRRLAGFVSLQKACQARVDKRSGGWKVLLTGRALVAALEEPEAPHPPNVAAFAAQALPLLKAQLAALRESGGFNPISVEVSSKSELDLFVLRKHLGSEDQAVRLDAVAAAGELEYHEAVGDLLARLEVEEDGYVLSKLTRVLGQLGGESVLRVLAPYLEHADDRVRANTVEGVEAIPGDEKFRLLMPLLDDPAPRVRANALKAIQGLGREGFGALVKTMAHHPDVEHRLSVLYVLGHMNNAFARERLEELCRDEHHEVQRRAIELLGRRPEPKAAAALVALVRSQCGPRVRSQGLNALGSLRAAAPPALAAQVDALLRGVVGELGVERGQPADAADQVTDATELLMRLAVLCEPPPEPPPAPEPPPEPSQPEPAPKAEEADDGGPARGPDPEVTKKILARMNATLSALDPRERRTAEKMIKSGKVQNDSQLRREVKRMRDKRKGK